MRVLALFAHPVRRSFTGVLLDRFAEGLAEAGHAIEVADLYREGFTAFFKPEDYAQFSGGAMPEEVRREQARVDRADGLAFIFPVWWWSFPAILKNYIDRVFSEGWAYHFTVERSEGMLKDRPTLLLCSAATRRRTYAKYGYDAAMTAQIDTGILGYCGIKDVRKYLFYEVDTSPELRARYLEEARALGRAFPERLALMPGEAAE